MNVLIVDDSKIICDGLRKMLTMYEDIEIIGQVHNAQDAIKAILEFSPDVVILDIRLPGRSGIDVLKDVRAKAISSRIIVLTNYPYPQYRKKCMDLGADYFFDKVTEIDEIPEVLRQLSGNASATARFIGH